MRTGNQIAHLSANVSVLLSENVSGTLSRNLSPREDPPRRHPPFSLASGRPREAYVPTLPISDFFAPHTPDFPVFHFSRSNAPPRNRRPRSASNYQTAFSDALAPRFRFIAGVNYSRTPTRFLFSAGCSTPTLGTPERGEQLPPI